LGYNNSKSKNLRHIVKYEELRQNTHEELERIYKFLGIEISKEEMNNIVRKFSFENIAAKNKGEGKQTRSATPGKWKENFSSKEQRILVEIVGETLKEFGYEQ